MNLLINMNESKRTKFNAIILGESRVGKTALIDSLCHKPFNENSLLTAGVDFQIVEREMEGKIYKFKIFDTAGQERFKSISKSSIKLADGILLVFAVDNSNTFDKISEWIASIKEEVNESEKAIILAGNKIDIEDREISYDKALEFAEDCKFKYYETSAKTNVGVQEVFNELFKDIYNLNKNASKISNITLKEQQKKDSKCC